MVISHIHKCQVKKRVFLFLRPPTIHVNYYIGITIIYQYNIPEFWDTNLLAPSYSLSQKSQYVWGKNR